MKKVLFGYIMNGKAGGIDKYMLNFFEHFSPGEVHFDFLTTQIDNELKEKLESKGAGLFEIPTLKNPRAQYKAICDIIKKNGYRIFQYFYRDMLSGTQSGARLRSKKGYHTFSQCVV